jgi:hypothetical protein
LSELTIEKFSDPNWISASSHAFSSLFGSVAGFPWNCFASSSVKDPNNTTCIAEKTTVMRIKDCQKHRNGLWRVQTTITSRYISIKVARENYIGNPLSSTDFREGDLCLR